MISDLTKKFEGEHYRPKRAMVALELALNLQQAYEGDAGVDEGYTIRQHTLMVLLQFDRYFSHRSLPLNLPVSFWRLLLALHDVLGKPQALQLNNKDLQHKILHDNLPGALRQLGYDVSDIRLSQELLANSCIGSYVQVHITPADVVMQAMRLGEAASSSADDALAAMMLYWMVDAGSYTEDAGGKQSLDYLFQFDHQNRIMRVNNPARQRLLVLKSLV